MSKPERQRQRQRQTGGCKSRHVDKGLARLGMREADDGWWWKHDLLEKFSVGLSHMALELPVWQ